MADRILQIELCRLQLLAGSEEELQDNLPEPEKEWRCKCASILGKKRKLLSEVFVMAQLPKAVWQRLKEVAEKYQKGTLKGQKPSLAEVLTLPALKGTHLRCLSGLSNADRMHLLEKVNQGTMSLEEMKIAAADIKKLRPVQEAVLNFFQIKTWEEAQQSLGEDVSAECLSRFMDEDLNSHDFHTFLKRIKAKKERGKEKTRNVEMQDAFVYEGEDGEVTTGYLLEGTLSTVKATDIESATTSAFCGAFLTVSCISWDTAEVKQKASLAAKLAKHVNFTLMTSFNVAVLVAVKAAIEVENVFREDGACGTTIGYIYVKGLKNKDSLCLVQSMSAFVVGHWAMSSKVTKRHVSFGPNEDRDNLVIGDVKDIPECSEGDRPVPVLEWLISHFSQPEDTVILLNTVSGFLAALRNKRTCIRVDESNDTLFSARESISQAIKRAKECVNEVEEILDL